jgi:glycosyltransferase involved in cell wall biosynthesis
MLLDNADLRNDFARRGIQRIGESFSWEKAARQMTQLYTKVMAA